MNNENLINYFIDNMDTHTTISELKRYRRNLIELQERGFTDQERKLFLDKIAEHTSILKNYFINLNNLLEKTNNTEYKEVLLYKYFPYKYFYDINKDISLYKSVSPSYFTYPIGNSGYGDGNLLCQDISRLINFLLDSKSSSQAANLFTFYEPNITNFYVNPKFFGKSTTPYPNNYKISEDFIEMSKSGILVPEILGRFGELQVNNILEHDYDNVIWVSRDLGDGFGYDIGIYNAEDDSYKAVEVKSTMKEDNLGRYKLSFREKDRMLIENDNCENYVYNVLIGKDGSIEQSKILNQKTYKKRFRSDASE